MKRERVILSDENRQLRKSVADTKEKMKELEKVKKNF